MVCKWLKVLSLFDGMSCWMIALERAWFKVDTYYASEIDKYSQIISNKNYPNIVRLGDVNNWREWDIWDIDLIIWWSPCQWFSFAWKQLAFDDPRSKLFFTMVDIINHYKPKYFLLENVKMKKEFQDVITQYMWVQPIEINSSLVSAQNRKRLYWTNIPWVEKPKDKWILLKDIIEIDVDDKYNISEKQWDKLRNYESNSRLSNLLWKSSCLNTMQWWHRQPKIAYAPWSREFSAQWWKENKSLTLTARDYKDPKIIQYPRWFNKWWVFEEKSPTLSSNSWQENNVVWMQVWQSKSFGNSWGSEKWYTIKTTTWHWMIDFDNLIIRKLTPLECERLQTMPDNYTEWVSNSQRYKMLWNWWTVDVISHILSYIIKNG